MDEALRDSCAQGVPMLAICLGMQLLASSSEESPGVTGLGVIDGHVRKLTSIVSDDAQDRVPDTGWARVNFTRPSLGFSVHEPRNFYFSHSYYFAPSDSSVVSGTKERETTEIPVLLEQGAIVAAQFHPEKSGPEGIGLIRSWIESKVL
jgi:glutamine amidotransferase